MASHCINITVFRCRLGRLWSSLFDEHLSEHGNTLTRHYEGSLIYIHINNGVYEFHHKCDGDDYLSTS